jgi:lipocalin
MLLLLPLISCQTVKELPTVDQLDLTRYAGTWYEIARLPNRFEKGLECVSATYTLRDDGKITVENRGHSIEDHTKTSYIKGVAWVPDQTKPGQIKVRFFWPFAGRYWVIALGQEYNYALVGDPSRKFLWVLAKNKDLDETIYLDLIKIAEEQGFEVDKVIRVKQDCNSGPGS